MKLHITIVFPDQRKSMENVLKRVSDNERIWQTSTWTEPTWQFKIMYICILYMGPTCPGHPGNSSRLLQEKILEMFTICHILCCAKFLFSKKFSNCWMRFISFPQVCTRLGWQLTKASKWMPTLNFLYKIKTVGWPLSCCKASWLLLTLNLALKLFDSYGVNINRY